MSSISSDPILNRLRDQLDTTPVGVARNRIVEEIISRQREIQEQSRRLILDHSRLYTLIHGRMPVVVTQQISFITAWYEQY